MRDVAIIRHGFNWRRSNTAFAVLITLASVAPSSAEEAPANKRLSLAQCLEQLHAASYPERESAMERLFLAGDAALPWLARGLASEHAEAQWRSAEVLRQLALTDNATRLPKIAAIFQQAADKGQPQLARVANELKSEETQIRHSLAVEKLSAAGANMIFPEIEEEIEDFIEEDPFGPDIAVLDEIAEPEPEMADVVPGAEHVIEFAAGDTQVQIDLDPTLPEAVRGTAETILGSLLPGRVGDSVRRALGVGTDDLSPAEMHDEFEMQIAPGDGGRRLADLLPPTERNGEPFGDAAPLQLPAGPPLADDPFGQPEPALPIAEDKVAPPGVAAAPDPFADPPAQPFGEPIADPGELVKDADAEEVILAGPVIPGVIDVDAMDGATGVLWITEEWKGGDAALASLADVQQLGSIMITNVPFTDAALEHIGKVKKLKFLQLRGVSMTRDALAKFHQTHPQVALMAMGDVMMGVNAKFQRGVCRLENVSPNTGAAEAGLQAGDEIRQIDSQEIDSFSSLTINIYPHKPGDKVRVLFRRNGEDQETTVTLKARPVVQ